MAQRGVSEPASNEENEGSLCGIFLINNAECEVELTVHLINWKQCSHLICRNTASESVAGFVELENILSAKTSANVTAGPTNACIGDIIQVHYCERCKDNKWKHHLLELKPVITMGENGEISSVDVNLWVDKIEQYMTSKGCFSARPKELKVFINPAGGQRIGEKIYKDKVAPIFDLVGIHADVTVTQHAGQANDIVRDMDLFSIDGIVSVGGDGTFREIVDGVMFNVAQHDTHHHMKDSDNTRTLSSVHLSAIPSGTGQGISYCLNGTKDATTAALHIATGQTQKPLNIASLYSVGKLQTHSAFMQATGSLNDIMKSQNDNKQSSAPMRAFRALGSGLCFFYQWPTQHVQLEYIPFTTESHTVTGASGSSDEIAGWVREELDVRMMLAWPFDIKSFYGNVRETDDTAHFDILIINNNCSRTTLFKWLARVATYNSDWDDLNFRKIKCKTYRVKWNLDHRNTSPIIVNVDGDILPLAEPEYEVRLHPNVLRVYGGGALGSHKKK